MGIDKVKEEQRKMLRAIIIGVVVISFYLAGMLNTLFTRYGVTFNPFKIIKCMYVNGFPFGLFVIFLLIFGVIGGYSYLSAAKEAEGMDKMGRLFKMSTKRKGYGDTHFEEPEEYKEAALVQSPKDAYGTILGQLDDSGKKLINFRMDEVNRLNGHIAIVGASGSGKSYTFSKPYLFQTVKRRESVIVTDPDGGLYRDTAGYMEDNGYIVRRLDLSAWLKSDGWDCLSSIADDDPEKVILNAQVFSNTVISNLFKDKDNVYANGGMALLNALILRVFFGHEYPDDKKNIKSVYELLQNPEGEKFLDRMFDPLSLTPSEKPCLGPYQSYKQGSDNLRGNIITNLSVNLKLFQSDLVCRVLSENDIDLTLPATQPCAYYCIFPDSHDTYQFIVSLYFSMQFTRLINYADNQPNGRCPIPVNFLLDEFPSIGVLPDFDRKMSTIRKRAMNVAMIFQDFTQLQNNYREKWVTLLSNCSTFLSLGINDEYTSNWVTRRIGETTIQVQTEQHAAMESIFHGANPHSTGEGKRALLTFDELFKLDKDDSIIIFQGHNPIWARKYPYVLHPDAKKLRPILPSDIPDFTDVDARELRNKERHAKVAAYLVKHPLSEVDRSYADVCEYKSEPKASDKIVERAKEIVKPLKSTAKTTSKKNYSKKVLGMDSVPRAAVPVIKEEPLTVLKEESFVVDWCGYSIDPSTGAVIEDASGEIIEEGTSNATKPEKSPQDAPEAAPATQRPTEQQNAQKEPPKPRQSYVNVPSAERLKTMTQPVQHKGTENSNSINKPPAANRQG